MISVAESGKTRRFGTTQGRCGSSKQPCIDHSEYYMFSLHLRRGTVLAVFSLEGLLGIMHMHNRPTWPFPSESTEEGRSVLDWTREGDGWHESERQRLVTIVQSTWEASRREPLGASEGLSSVCHYSSLTLTRVAGPP